MAGHSHNRHYTRAGKARQGRLARGGAALLPASRRRRHPRPIAVVVAAMSFAALLWPLFIWIKRRVTGGVVGDGGTH